MADREMIPADGIPDGERPLLRKPKPEFMSSKEMLAALWRKSQWALDDAAFDYGLEYAILDPKMEEFKDFALAVLVLGHLPASAKVGNSEFRDVKIRTFGDPGIFNALLKGCPVNCEVHQAPGTLPWAFSQNASTEWAEREVWFKRSDVENLTCDADTVRLAMKNLAEDDPHADEELAAYIATANKNVLSVIGSNEPAEPIAVVAVINPAPLVTTAVAVTEPAKRRGQKQAHLPILDLIQPVLDGKYGNVPKDFPDFKRKLVEVYAGCIVERTLGTPPYTRVPEAYDEWAKANNAPKRKLRK